MQTSIDLDSPMCREEAKSAHARTSDEGLIATATRDEKGIRVGVLVVLLAGAAVLGTLVCDTFFPVTERRVYGLEKYLPQAPKGFVSGGAARRIEKWIDKRSLVKRRSRSLYALALCHWFGEAGDSMISGEDQVLFLRDRLTLEGQTKNEAITDVQLMVSTVARKVRAHGARFVFMPVPRKVTLDAEAFPPTIPSTAGFDAEVIDAIRDLGVETVNLLAHFEGTQSDELQYFPHDSHWNFETRAAAMRALGRQLNLTEGEPWKRPTERRAPSRAPRDLYRYLGILNEDLDQWTSPAEQWIRHPLTPRKLPPTGGRRAWLFGTSFTADQRISDLLGYFASTGVENRSEGGGHPLFGVIESLKDPHSAEGLAEVFVFEYPLHMVLPHGLNYRARAALSLLPSAEGGVHLSMPHVLTLAEGLLGSKPPAARSRSLGFLACNRMLRTPNGAVVLRLVSKAPPKATTQVRVTDPARSMIYDWPAGQTHCDVPLPTEDHGQDRLEFFLMTRNGGPLDLVLEEMTLLLDGVDVAGYTSQPGRLTEEAGDGSPVWKQQVRIDPPLRAHDGPYDLLFEVKTGESSQRPARLYGLSPDGERVLLFEFQGVDRLGYVTFPSSLAQGLDLAAVEFIGPGAAPLGFVAEARILLPAPIPSD